MLMLLTRFISVILFLKEGFVTPRVVCMNKKVDAKQFTLNCTVDDFTSDIDIIFPKNVSGYAYCIVPVSSETNCSCICHPTTTCACFLSQDISTKTTTLQIINKDLPSMFGCYTCVHGSYKESRSISISPKQTCASDQENDQTTYIVGWTVLSVVTLIALVSTILTCFFSDIPGRILNILARYHCKDKGNADYQPLKDYIDCATCNTSPTCALCMNCKNFYCDICCVHHEKTYSNHIVFQTQQIAAQQRKRNCKKCKNIAERFCSGCWFPYCISCAKPHKCQKKVMLIIYQAQSECKRQKSAQVKKEIHHLFSVSLPDDKLVRITGIAYLGEGTIVAVDSKNYRFIVFKSGEEKWIEATKDEPSAITAMTGNEFAVTFPSKMEILIYKLTIDTRQTCKITVKMNIKTEDKPFTIAYYQERFAVEVGECEDGRIDIYDSAKDGYTKTKTVPCPFPYYTGHTIRLALDRDRIFISSLGKKMVTCLDFHGKQLWKQCIPSPRSIIVPEDESLGDIILLASKRCNAIYEMQKENGEYEILKSTHKIRSPRYMAYQSDTNTFCVLLNTSSNKVELASFKFNDADPVKETSCNSSIELIPK